MDQSSKNKVKLFRTLKVVFYCLGLPLFALAVVLTAATEYVGEFAYTGMAETELFASMKVLFNGTALYGVWVAAGVWLIIAISHIIIAKTVKNRRARTFIVAAVTLVVMLVPVVVMDIAIPIRLDRIQADAPEGVTIASYEDEKGHFYTRTSASWTANGKYESNNYYFVTAVENFLKTYNIGMYGGTKSGTANNTSNTPVTYGRLYLDSEGIAPFAGETAIADKLVKIGTTITVGGQELAVTQNGDGLLQIGDMVFTEYYYGASNGLWYRTSATAQMGDGKYGYASYNSNGMLSDGYVYGLDSALEILEDYYYSQMMITELENAATMAGTTLPTYDEIISGASAAREAYYTDPSSEASDYERWLWGKQTAISEDFSLTQGELKSVLDALGSGIASVDLIGSLLDFIGGLVNPKDENGEAITPPNGGIQVSTGGITIYVYIAPVTPADGGNPENMLTIELAGDAASAIGEGPYYIGLDSRLISSLSQLLDGLVSKLERYPADAATGTPAVMYNSVAEVVYDVLNGGGSGTISTVGTIMGIVEGLIDIIGDITGLITIETDDAGNVTTTTEGMLYGLIENLLSGLYWYSSSEIKPLYDFYVDGLGESASDEAKEYAQYYADYDRAVYEGGMHGYMIGSVLVPGSSVIAGDTLGNGSYSATVPASYAEVMQLKTELTYKRWLYPLLGVRECLVCFMPFVVLFIILSGVAAEKEMLYATGQETAKSKKNKKKEDEEEAILFAEESDKQTASETAVAEDVPVTPLPEEGTATLVADENDKEVL